MMNPTSMQDLELMTYQQKVEYWGRAKNPWNPDGKSVRFGPKKLAGPFHASCHQGNVLSMPLLIGRPCFGIVTALFRYRDAKRWVKDRGVVPTSRCENSCPVRVQCEKVVDARVKDAPQVRSVHDRWMIADGPRQMLPENPFGNVAGGIFRRMAFEAAAVQFSSVNDPRITEHYKQKAERDRLKERDKKRAMRRKALVAGEIDDDHQRDLIFALDARIKHLLVHWDKAQIDKAPPRLAKLPRQSLNDMFESWYGRELLKAQREEYGPTQIAKWIQAHRPQHRQRSHAALVTRVSKDLRRIADFESWSIQGESLLPAFDPAREFKNVP
jgi:hypothetical protein